MAMQGSTGLRPYSRAEERLTAGDDRDRLPQGPQALWDKVHAQHFQQLDAEDSEQHPAEGRTQPIRRAMLGIMVPHFQSSSAILLTLSLDGWQHTAPVGLAGS